METQGTMTAAPQPVRLSLDMYVKDFHQFVSEGVETIKYLILTHKSNVMTAIQIHLMGVQNHAKLKEAIFVSEILRNVVLFVGTGYLKGKRFVMT